MTLADFNLAVFQQERLLTPFCFNDPAPTEIYTLSLHDALPILQTDARAKPAPPEVGIASDASQRLLLEQELQDLLGRGAVVVDLHCVAARRGLAQRQDGRAQIGRAHV